MNQISSLPAIPKMKNPWNSPEAQEEKSYTLKEVLQPRISKHALQINNYRTFL